MAKRTKQQKPHSGNNLEILPYFLYEVSIYEIMKKKVRLLNTRYYKSNKSLKIHNKDSIKKYANKLIVRYIDLIGAPKEYIDDERKHNL